MKFHAIAAALLLSAPLYAHAGATASQTGKSVETVTIHEVKFGKRPPFKRSIEVLNAADLAVQETARTVVVSNTDYRGKPPYKRNVERLRVVDTAVMETAVETTDRVFGPRHHSNKVVVR